MRHFTIQTSHTSRRPSYNCEKAAYISYEDIGLASPGAGQRTLAAIESAERLGFPEARIPLSQAVIELCLSPKSNSAIRSIDAALSDIRKGHIGQVPDYLKDGHYQGAKALGRAVGYQYPHNHPNGFVAQQYLPELLKTGSITRLKRRRSQSNSLNKYTTIFDSSKTNCKVNFNINRSSDVMISELLLIFPIYLSLIRCTLMSFKMLLHT